MNGIKFNFLLLFVCSSFVLAHCYSFPAFAGSRFKDTRFRGLKRNKSPKFSTNRPAEATPFEGQVSIQQVDEEEDLPPPTPKSLRQSFRRWLDKQLDVNPRSIARKLPAFIDRQFFLFFAVVVIAAAAIAPGLGCTGGPLHPELTVNKLGVSILFFLSGVMLKPSDLANAALDIRLNSLVGVAMYGVWPVVCTLLMLLLKPLNYFHPSLLDGLLVLGSLPCTVNMCVAFTQSAGGNGAAAVFNAVAGNMSGVVMTPALIYLYFKKAMVLPFEQMTLKLVKKVLLPLTLGTAARHYLLKGKYAGIKKGVKRATDVCLLAIIYTTFCDMFDHGLAVSRNSLASMIVLMSILHGAALSASFWVARKFKFSREDQVAIMFCSAHKTLAFGLPLIKTMFGAQKDLALIATPLLIFHPIGLIMGSILVPYLKSYVRRGKRKQLAVA